MGKVNRLTKFELFNELLKMNCLIHNFENEQYDKLRLRKRQLALQLVFKSKLSFGLIYISLFFNFFANNY